MLPIYQAPVIQEINEPLFQAKGIRLFIKREDLIHPEVSGNKWRKLKYNLLQARELGKKTLLTFGGAFSNHIYATAAAAKEAGFKSIGIIRGEETLPLNPTLVFAQSCGMQLEYISRSAYREKKSEIFLNSLMEKFGDFHLIPEGGSNRQAVQGCAELVEEVKEPYDHWVVSVGTGGTMAGIICGLAGKSNVIGTSALKGGDFLTEEVRGLMLSHDTRPFDNWRIETEYHFGGYAKINDELVTFINEFKSNHHIQLDPVYTGKMMMAIYDIAKKGAFKKGESILAIHTGGLQGIKGINARYGDMLH
ncbi:MAG: pyridoxal-phosphate dependent enzyme [Bacteroidota bacterium]